MSESSFARRGREYVPGDVPFHGGDSHAWAAIMVTDMRRSSDFIELPRMPQKLGGES
ncbi:hypothetical protein AB3662_14630 [Sorangium cellulosum]|uniref:hypothetical protein n=1 Tax=Sorangium cellulosum TaxID=56 RepID=UPI003D9A6E25